MALLVPPYEWQCVTDDAAFPGMDGAAALVFDGRMWLLGGWNPRDKVNFPGPPHGPKDCNSRVYSSSDGETWVLETPEAPWEGRHTAGAAVHDGRMWIIGGDPIQGHYQPDVWSSRDGKIWECATTHAPWGDRILHMTAAFNGALFVMGGQSSPSFGGQAGQRVVAETGSTEDVYHADVWRSVDGASWTCVADDCPWAPRGMISGSAILDGRMYLLGGGTYETASEPGRFFYNDVWSTADGVEWRQDCAECPWDPRQYHDIAVFDDRLWVLAGGTFGGSTLEEKKYRTIEQMIADRAADPKVSTMKANPRTGKPDTNRNDCWFSTDGQEWHELVDTPWLPRHANSVFVFDDSLWMVSGNNGDHVTLESDAWRLNRRGTGARL